MRRTRMAKHESGIARTRRLMREQRCHNCEGKNPDVSKSAAGKTRHFHVACM